LGGIVNNGKEVIQCLIVYRRSRRHSRPGFSPLRGSARPELPRMSGSADCGL